MHVCRAATPLSELLTGFRLPKQATLWRPRSPQTHVPVDGVEDAVDDRLSIPCLELWRVCQELQARVVLQDSLQDTHRQAGRQHSGELSAGLHPPTGIRAAAAAIAGTTQLAVLS